jgi:site-specific recombinase XerD
MGEAVSAHPLRHHARRLRHTCRSGSEERRIEAFVRCRRRQGRTYRGYRQTLLDLVEQVHAAEVVRAAEPRDDDTPAAALLARYAAYLRHERGITEGTIAAYHSFVRAFVVERLDGGTGRPDALAASDVREFLLARVRSLIPKRAQYLATTLRSFLRFLFLRGETAVDLSLAVPTVRRWRLSSVPRYLPAEDVHRLLQSCDLSSATGRRDHAILLLLARLGLRAGKLIALDLDDLHWRTGEIVVRGKGLVRDRLPMLPDVGKALASYLEKDRPSCGSRRVFLCRRAPLRGISHPSTISTIVARALGRAGLKPAMRGAHLLRHSLATTMVRRGASLAEIGQVLRHRSPNTTEIYAKLDFDKLRDVAMPWPTAGGAR